MPHVDLSKLESKVKAKEAEVAAKANGSNGIAKAERINHPAHYNQIEGIECIDVVKHFGFVTGNIIKYAWRAGLKTDSSRLDDLRKRLWYAQLAVEMESNHEQAN